MRRLSQIDQNEDECTSSTYQILERVQPDRVTVTKPEEDRRRRTIIVEKKNGSYGFTLQSYGIHYKKEQEIEMITYVDYVDYDGPAYRSGMREGDVILSINGTDMEKADHKTLVNFIKSSESRMRMVVLFEDCVRKVELHIRYIQLQRILQNKMAELEKVCIMERDLLEGKWKTHSLPARKKTSQQITADERSTPSQASYAYYRPTVSTEDVAEVQQSHNNSAFNFAYRYLDSQCRYLLHSTPSGSEYLLTFNNGKNINDHHLIVKTPSEAPKTKLNKGNQTNISNIEKQKKVSTCHGYAGNLCNPCVQLPNNSDNTSLEAYDLASPCCDPHCVPNRRRQKHKDHAKRRDSRKDETQSDMQTQKQRPPRSRPHSQASQTSLSYSRTQHAPRKYFQLDSGLLSQCSLHSCTSSELSAVVPITSGESSASCTTSLSTDTLYWNGSCDINSYKYLSDKSKYECQRYSQPPSEPIYVQYNMKPKSWDNLATKAYGGYGFGGYEYIDTLGKNSKSGSIRSNSSTKTQSAQFPRTEKSITQPTQFTVHNQRRYSHRNKSTENLLTFPKCPDTVNSCECSSHNSPIPDTAESRFFQSPRESVVSPTDPNFGYYSARKQNSKQVSTSSEATRL
ncbi:hypothetical protein WA026_020183 [Henosepilachna vigintioctopunctata]|uniref:PDZ domain-containing protein n=1 Tax=Henosepilachna vigintioctopunctata TaxID=420089 RepID=A0AAW1UAN5_9CUCU